MSSVSSRASIEQEKLIEKTSLLMRVYWQDDIFKIGKELYPDYFSRFAGWWDMNHYQGALEIARNIDDYALARILSTHPKPYGIPLGGFQGKYYSLSQSGQLSIVDSQGDVKRNLCVALEKWGDRAYGILQALINKNGRAAYFDLIDEIGRVLGYEFTPSYILPRLAPMRLVFKTGSNKYPDWTMPSEIIPVVQGEVRGFKRPTHPSRTRPAITDSLLKQMRAGAELVSAIIEARRNLDTVFESKFKIRLFKQNEMAVDDLRKTCNTEEEFNNRILNLALLINEIEQDRILKLIKGKVEAGSINMIEKILHEYVGGFDEAPVRNLRMIIALRSKRHPIHRDDPLYLDALRYFGFTEVPPDWQALWDTILRRYLESLQALISTLLRMQ